MYQVSMTGIASPAARAVEDRRIGLSRKGAAVENDRLDDVACAHALDQCPAAATACASRG